MPASADEAAFLSAIRADPAAGTHLIYADWLDERGRHALADALRGQWGEPIVWALSRQPLLDADRVLRLLNEGWVPAYWPGFAAFVRAPIYPDRRTILSFRPPGEAAEVYRAAVALTLRSNAARFLGREPGEMLCEGRDVVEEDGPIRVTDRFRLIYPRSAVWAWREAYPQTEFSPLFPAGADLSEPPALWMPQLAELVLQCDAAATALRMAAADMAARMRPAVEAMGRAFATAGALAVKAVGVYCRDDSARFIRQRAAAHDD